MAISWNFQKNTDKVKTSNKIFKKHFENTNNMQSGAQQWNTVQSCQLNQSATTACIMKYI